MTVVMMSMAELSRVETLAQVAHGVLPVKQAATVLGLSERQESGGGVPPGRWCSDHRVRRVRVVCGRPR